MSEALRRLSAEPLRRFKRYPAYKDSGVEWLGEIPAHWEVKRLKRLVEFRGGGTPTKDSIEYWRGDIPWVSPKDMKVWIVDDTEDKITLQAVRESATKLVPKGAVLIVVRSGILAHSIPVAIAGRELTLNQDLKALIPREILLSDYLAQFISGKQRELLVAWKKEGATVESLELDLVTQTPTLVPPPPEQRAIAAFLDRETARIDALVAKKERLIELLQEKRTALITRAVTKGLDPTVPMKHSGVEWLGEIPAHWEVKPVGAVADSLVGFPFPSDDFSFDEGTRLLRGDNVTTESLRWGDKTRAWRKPAPHPRYYLKAGDVVIGMDGSKVGRNYAVVREEDLPLLLVQRVTRLRARRAVLPEFLFFSIAGPRFHAHVDTCKSDPAIPHITLKNIESFLIAVPPKSEQLAIHDKIQSEARTLTALLERVREAIERLKELRIALISAAVTGKIDVREAA